MSVSLVFSMLITVSAGPAGAVMASPGLDQRAVVLPFTNATGEKSLYWMGEAFAHGVSDHLLAAGMDTVDPQRRREASNEMGLDASEPPTLASAILLARRLNASLVILGELSWQSPHRITISSRLIKVSEPSVGDPIVLKGSLHELYRLQKKHASLLVPSIGSRTPHAQVPPLQVIQEVPLPSFEAYIKAVSTEDLSTRRSFLERSLEADPTFAPALIERARLELREGRAHDALLLLDRVQVEQMAFPERYWLARGDTAAARGDRGSAVDLYHKALARRNWPLAHFRLAAILAQQGKLMEARQEVEAGLIVDPGHPVGNELREALTPPHETPS